MSNKAMYTIAGMLLFVMFAVIGVIFWAVLSMNNNSPATTQHIQATTTTPEETTIPQLEVSGIEDCAPAQEEYRYAPQTLPNLDLSDNWTYEPAEEPTTVLTNGYEAQPPQSIITSDVIFFEAQAQIAQGIYADFQYSTSLFTRGTPVPAEDIFNRANDVINALSSHQIQSSHPEVPYLFFHLSEAMRYIRDDASQGFAAQFWHNANQVANMGNHPLGWPNPQERAIWHNNRYLMIHEWMMLDYDIFYR